MDGTSNGSSKKLKACTNCTNAKTKCTPYGNLNNLCERCHRLGKTCQYAEATVRPKKNRQSSRKQLEEKVDSLVNLLSVMQTPPAPSNAALSVSNSRSPAVPVRSAPFHPSPAADSGVGSSNMDTPQVSPEEAPVDVLETMSIETQNQLFSKYCRGYVQEFPFVTFAPSETVSTMQMSRPLTLKSLLAVALHPEVNAQRKALSEVTNIIKKAMLSRLTYSFDLLQAILIQAAYYHLQFRSRQQELMLFIHYAITLTHEIGIDKSPSDKRLGMTAHGMLTSPMEGVKYEQWRALLGVYYEAAIFAQAFRKPRLMQYTRYMDQCRRKLVETLEVQTDYSLNVLISMQNVCLDALDIFTLYDFETAEVTGDLAIKTLVRGMLDRLGAIEENAKRGRNAILLPNEHRLLLYARAYVHEVAVHRDFWQTSTDAQNSAISATRAQLGWEGLETAKTLATYYANLPPEDWLKLDSGPCTQMLYSMIMLNKYVSLDSADPTPNSINQWDVQLAFKEAEVERLGMKIVEQMAPLAVVERLYDEGRPVWWALGWIVKNMVHGHQQRICGGLQPFIRPSNEAPVAASQRPAEEDSPAQEQASAESARIDKPTELPFATSFPDITFDNTMLWSEEFQSSMWDTMMNDMTTLPFG